MKTGVYRQAVRLGSIEAVEELPSASMPKKQRKIKKKIDRIAVLKKRSNY